MHGERYRGHYTIGMHGEHYKGHCTMGMHKCKMNFKTVHCTMGMHREHYKGTLHYGNSWRT